MTPGFGAGLVIPDLWQQDAVRTLQQGKDPPSPRPWRDKRGGAGADGFRKTYIFELFYPDLKQQAVFTVPTRALANDKLAEWRARASASSLRLTQPPLQLARLNSCIISSL